MKKNCFILIFQFAAFLPQAYSQVQQSSGSLSDLSFIQGSWVSTSKNKNIDAFWSAPTGDNIVGFVRVIKDSKAVMYELFAFEQTEKGLMALVRHFKPGLVSLEEKDKPDRYHFIKAGDGWAIFEKQGENVRVLYEERSEGEFVIALGHRQDGEWIFKDFWEFEKR